MLKKIFRLLILGLLICNTSFADQLNELIEKLKKTEKELEASFASTMVNDNGKLYKSFKEIQSVNKMVIKAIENGDIDIALASIDISLKTSKSINSELPGKFEVQNTNISRGYRNYGDDIISEFSKNMFISKELKTLKSFKVINDTVEIMNLKDDQSIKQVSKNLSENKELKRLANDFKINYSLKGTGITPKTSAQFISALNELGVKPIVSFTPGTTTTITRQWTKEDFLKQERDREWAENLFGQLKAEDFAISKEFTLDKSDISSLSNEVADQAKEASKEFDAQAVADQLDSSAFDIPEKYRKETPEGAGMFDIPEEFRAD